MVWCKKTTCAHCNRNETRRELEGKPTCVECRTRILASREPVRQCPVDGVTLIKEHNSEVLIDRCPQCRGGWLDGGELERIQSSTQEAALRAMAVGLTHPFS